MLRRWRAVVALAGTVAITGAIGAGCGVERPNAPGGGEQQVQRLRVMAPAAPGGGWDSSSRALQKVIESEKLARSVEVFNVTGAGGTVGLAQLASSSEDELLMTMGLVMLGAIETNKSTVKLDNVTPIARLTGEPLVLVVPASSPHQTLEDFIAAWKADPGANAIAGGSAGGADQILAGQVAKASGIDPKSVNYVAFSGGGESLAALLGAKVAAGISGVGEYAQQVEAGQLRALATSGTEPSSQLPDVKTLQDQGVDVELTNWRGLVARPGMSADATKRLVDLVTKAHDSKAWQDTLSDNGWEDQFLPGDDFGQFMGEEQQRVREILIDIGLVEQ